MPSTYLLPAPIIVIFSCFKSGWPPKNGVRFEIWKRQAAWVRKWQNAKCRREAVSWRRSSWAKGEGAGRRWLATDPFWIGLKPHGTWAPPRPSWGTPGTPGTNPCSPARPEWTTSIFNESPAWRGRSKWIGEKK
ncbi:hypothetical protein B0T26DRAFT_700112 [Lasiosphaeria miniovina]|uniref:Uncharacterized protein n=1 Tax=Lasiosphaeria miniovina TaxID=1954250 RepID=A0AA40ATH8_9PEZI|nr:uncharacterized protein B0T26DRAFT_700112 [Lasiosphaeria miniovina]KAK0721719.1 hypothetical protein B0T26DRAFT_700112 [Lasiosphaeria miniovina]